MWRKNIWKKKKNCEGLVAHEMDISPKFSDPVLDFLNLTNENYILFQFRPKKLFFVFLRFLKMNIYLGGMPGGAGGGGMPGGAAGGGMPDLSALFSDPELMTAMQVSAAFIICDKVLKNRPSKICGKQPLKKLI